MMATEICITYTSHTDCISAWAVYIPCALIIVTIATIAIWSTWDQ